MHQQLLLHKLAFDLAQLYRSHAAAIGSEFARRVFLEAHQQVFRRRSSEGREQLFFKHGERSLQRFHIEMRSALGAFCCRGSWHIAADLGS